MQPITHSPADSAVAKTRARRAIQAATISDAAGDAPDGQQLATLRPILPSLTATIGSMPSNR